MIGNKFVDKGDYKIIPLLVTCCRGCVFFKPESTKFGYCTYAQLLVGGLPLPIKDPSKIHPQCTLDTATERDRTLCAIVFDSTDGDVKLVTHNE